MKLKEREEMLKLAIDLFGENGADAFASHIDNHKYGNALESSRLNLNKYRELFFASLEDKSFDITAAKNFHKAYRLYEFFLKYMAMNKDVNLEIVSNGSNKN